MKVPDKVALGHHIAGCSPLDDWPCMGLSTSMPEACLGVKALQGSPCSFKYLLLNEVADNCRYGNQLVCALRQPSC